MQACADRHAWAQWVQRADEVLRGCGHARAGGGDLASGAAGETALYCIGDRPKPVLLLRVESL